MSSTKKGVMVQVTSGSARMMGAAGVLVRATDAVATKQHRGTTSKNKGDRVRRQSTEHEGVGIVRCMRIAARSVTQEPRPRPTHAKVVRIKKAAACDEAVTDVNNEVAHELQLHVVW